MEMDTFVLGRLKILPQGKQARLRLFDRDHSMAFPQAWHKFGVPPRPYAEPKKVFPGRKRENIKIGYSMRSMP